MSDSKREEILEQIDTLCGRLADVADWDTSWAIRGLIDGLEENPAEAPGTSEDPAYMRAYRAGRDISAL